MLTPLELYQAMAECGLEVVAISDHDTLAGYRELRELDRRGALRPAARSSSRRSRSTASPTVS